MVGKALKKSNVTIIELGVMSGHETQLEEHQEGGRVVGEMEDGTPDVELKEGAYRDTLGHSCCKYSVDTRRKKCP